MPRQGSPTSKSRRYTDRAGSNGVISSQQAIQIASHYALQRFGFHMGVCHCLFHNPKELARRTGTPVPDSVTYVAARRRVWGVVFEDVAEVDGRTKLIDAGLIVDVDAETGEPSIKEPILF